MLTQAKSKIFAKRTLLFSSSHFVDVPPIKGWIM